MVLATEAILAQAAALEERKQAFCKHCACAPHTADVAVGPGRVSDTYSTATQYLVGPFRSSGYTYSGTVRSTSLAVTEGNETESTN